MKERGTHFVFGQFDEQEDLHTVAEAPHVVFNLPQHEDPDYDLRLETLGIKLANAELNRQRTVKKRAEVGDHVVIVEDGKHRRDYIDINDQFQQGQEYVIFSIYQEMATPLTKTNAPGTEEEMGYERIPDEAGMRMARAILQELQTYERKI